MSKRRKYDIRNKRSFIIIVILSVVIIGIFSLFIYKYSKISRIEYTIPSGTVLQDVLKNYVTIDDDAKLKIRWNGNYYLEYNDEKISLGKKVIAYNTVTGAMNLYGTFYEILSDGKIIENKNETILHNTTDAKFFKLDDREYLLVDSKIYSDDFSIETSNYLLVELDKGGNAKLSNNKINVKTISPTTLVSTKYTFDIANEILNFGEFDIDLKKIIGSTNQYVPESSGDGDDTDNDIDDDTENQPNNNVPNNNVGTGGTGAGGVVNNTDTGKEEDMEEILDKVKMTSIVRVNEGLEQIDIDYVIYDPYNEYGSVYVEVKSSGKVDVVYLSKTDTHLTLYDLKANTDYTLDFIYTTMVTDPDTGVKDYVPYTFEELELKTKMPEYSISLYKISTVKKELTYKIDLQDDFVISKVNVSMSLSNNKSLFFEDEDSIDVVNNKIGYITGKFDISDYGMPDEDTIITLTVESIETSNGILTINSTSTARFGGNYGKDS